MARSATQLAQGPEVNSQNPCEMPDMATCACHLMLGRQGQEAPGACWLASLPELMDNKFNETETS